MTPMATNPFVDAEQRTRNVVSKEVHSSGPTGDPEAACSYCGSDKCGGHHGDMKKDKKPQIWQELSDNKKMDWRHRLDDPNSFTKPADHNKRMGQVHHAMRENPQIKGAVKNERAHVIGSRVRLSYEPDFEALGQDIEWQMRLAAQVEDLWERDMEDPTYCYNDSSGSQTFSEQMGLAFMEGIGTGEAFGMFFEEPRQGANNRPIDTTFSFIDVSRLSTPQNKIGKSNIVQGKKVNKLGRVNRFYVADEIPGCSISNRFTIGASKIGRARRHSSVKPFNDWNSPQAVHWFDKERSGQHRALPELSSALKRIGMMERFEETMLDAAVRDASFAMWVESDAPNMAQAFSTNPGLKPNEFIRDTLGEMTNIRNNYYKKNKIELQHGSGRLPQLMTTERINSITPGSVSESSVPFGNNMSTAIARSIGIDPYTFTGRMEGVNFSTIRAALNQTWSNRKFKRDSIFTHLGTPIFVVWFEEKIARGEIRMPIGSNRTLSHLNYFYNNRRALTMCEFSGPGERQIDQIKGFRAQEGALNCGLQTRTRYYTDYTDTTFRKAVQKMAYEKKVMEENGLEMFLKGNNQEPRGVGTQSSDRVADGTSESRSN